MLFLVCFDNAFTIIMALSLPFPLCLGPFKKEVQSNKGVQSRRKEKHFIKL